MAIFYAHVANELNVNGLISNCCQKEPLPVVSISAAAVNSWYVTYFKVSKVSVLNVEI